MAFVVRIWHPPEACNMQITAGATQRRGVLFSSTNCAPVIINGGSTHSVLPKLAITDVLQTFGFSEQRLQASGGMGREREWVGTRKGGG